VVWQIAPITFEKAISGAKEDIRPVIAYVAENRAQDDIVYIFNKQTRSFIITPPYQIGTPYMPFWIPSVSHNPMGIPIEGDTMQQDEIPSYALVEALNDKNQPVYHYLFTYKTPVMGGVSSPPL
jgi:hypothetical protein